MKTCSLEGESFTKLALITVNKEVLPGYRIWTLWSDEVKFTVLLKDKIIANKWYCYDDWYLLEADDQINDPAFFFPLQEEKEWLEDRGVQVDCNYDDKELRMCMNATMIPEFIPLIKEEYLKSPGKLFRELPKIRETIPCAIVFTDSGCYLQIDAVDEGLRDEIENVVDCFQK